MSGPNEAGPVLGEPPWLTIACEWGGGSCFAEIGDQCHSSRSGEPCPPHASRLRVAALVAAAEERGAAAEREPAPGAVSDALLRRWDGLDEDQQRQAVEFLAMRRPVPFGAALDFEERTRP